MTTENLHRITIFKAQLKNILTLSWIMKKAKPKILSNLFSCFLALWSSREGWETMLWVVQKTSANVRDACNLILQLI